MIPIDYGNRVTRKSVGFVAEFCPFCRAICAHRLCEIRRKPTLYFLSVGSGGLLGREVECERCRIALILQSFPYAGVSKRNSQSIEDLVVATYPNIAHTWEPRLRMESDVACRRLDLAARQSLLSEPFELVAPLVESRCGQFHADWVTQLAVGIGLATWLGVAILIDVYGTPWGLSEGSINGTTAVLGILGVIVALGTDVQRFTSRRIIPPLARALAPLSPSEEDIDRQLAPLRVSGLNLPRFLRAPALMRAIRLVESPESSRSKLR